MSIRAGVVGTITFQQVDHAPHAEASAESNNKGLQSSDSGSEKLHTFLHFSGGIAPAMKKAARCGRQVTRLRDTLSRSDLYKSVGIVDVVIA